MTETRKPLTLKKLLSSETLLKLEAQKMFKEKGKVTVEAKKLPKLKVKKAPSPPPLLKKVKQGKEPLTKNELSQIQAKHEATVLSHVLRKGEFRIKVFAKLGLHNAQHISSITAPL